jgi:hypothetical protein
MAKRFKMVSHEDREGTNFTKITKAVMAVSSSLTKGKNHL